MLYPTIEKSIAIVTKDVLSLGDHRVRPQFQQHSHCHDPIPLPKTSTTMEACPGLCAS